MSTSGISFTGLFSGLDTASIVEQLIYIEKEPIRRLETKKTKLDYEKQDLQEVNNSLISLKGTLSTFVNGILLQNDAISENENIFTATATAAAAPGEYNIRVPTLAKNQIIRSAKYGPAYTYPNPSTSFTITADNGTGPAFTINVNTGDTFDDIVASINSATNGPDSLSTYGKAYVVTDEPGSRAFIVESLETGSAYDLNFTDDIPGAGGVLQDLGVFNAADGFANIYQAASDSQVFWNGLGLSNSTNQISNPVPGVTLNLVSADSVNTYKLTIGTDDDSIVSAVQSFVDQFNSTTDLMANFIKEDVVQKPKTSTDLKYGVLRGDYDLVSVKSDIRLKTTGYVDSSLSKYITLSLLGVESEPSVGSYASDNLTFDEDALRTALADDRDEVVSLLEGWADELDEYLGNQTKVSSIPEFAGALYRRVLGIDDRMDAIDDDIATWEERVSAEEERLRNSFALMEQLLQQMQTQSTYVNTQLQNLLKASSWNNKN